MSAIPAVFGGILFAAAWLLTDHFEPWRSFHSDLAAAAGLLCMGVSVWLDRPARGGKLPTAAVLLVAVAAIPWFQWLTQRLAFSGDAWIGSLYVAGLACAVAIGFRARAVRDEGGVMLCLTLAILVGALASSLISIAQVFAVDLLPGWAMPISVGDHARANLGQPNNAATLMSWGMLALLLLYERRRLSGGFVVAMVTLLMLGVAATQSRSALLYGPATALAIRALGKRCELRTRARSVMTLYAAELVFAFALPALLDAVGLPGVATVEDRGLGSTRWRIWPMLLHALTLSPWSGFGWLQVGQAQLLVADQYPPLRELFFQGHNLFIELLLWCGIPLGSLLVVAVCYWFVSRWRRVRSLDALIGILMVSVLGLHGLLELPYHYAYFLLPAGLWIGLVEAQTGARAVLSWRWAAALQVATLAVTVALVWQYPRVEEDFRLARFEGSKIGDVKAVALAPDAPMLSTLTEFLRFSRTPMRAGMSAAELDRMLAITRRYPYGPSLYRTAVALALNDRQDEACALFAKMSHMDDAKFYARARQALAELARGGDPRLSALLARVP